MLPNQKVKVTWNGANKKYYTSKGYNYTKNGDVFLIDLKDISKSSHSFVRFVCDYCKGEFQTDEESKFKTYKNLISQRKNTNKDCCKHDSCRSMKMNETRINNIINSNNLSKTHSHLLKEWSSRNDTELNQYTYASDVKVWWICNKGHEWKTEIKNRANKDCGCPYCSGKYACSDNCLSTINPELAKEWHPVKNGTLTPHNVTSGSKVKVWWICKKGHEWKSTVHHRSNNRTCPYCCGKKVSIDNCLATLNKEISLQWNYDKNVRITPFDVTLGSNKKVWWKCSEGHEWIALISSRAINGNGCPVCRESRGEKKIRAWLEMRNIEFAPQYEFNGLVGLGGSNLRFDFAVFNNENSLVLLIEYDGEFHYEKYYEEQNFETIQTHDKRKNQYCLKNDITLLRIPYWDYEKIEEILDRELN